jgi:hypothetical protein
VLTVKGVDLQFKTARSELEIEPEWDSVFRAEIPVLTEDKLEFEIAVFDGDTELGVATEVFEDVAEGIELDDWLYLKHRESGRKAQGWIRIHVRLEEAYDENGDPVAGRLEMRGTPEWLSDSVNIESVSPEIKASAKSAAIDKYALFLYSNASFLLENAKELQKMQE